MLVKINSMDKSGKRSTFRTEIETPTWSPGLNHSTRFFTVGSCFSENIGRQLSEMKVETTVNPFGTIYDPISIHRLLEYALLDQIPERSSIIERDGLFFCDEFHSSNHALNTSLLQDLLAGILRDAKAHLMNCNFVLITYGTAWVYHRKNSDKVVANCHKLPAALFEKRLLTISEITESFKKISDTFIRLNSNVRFLLTVSPVRHLKDKLEGNSLSKSILRVAANELADGSRVFYYPAFEIMNDDLRDYRFYGSDLIHPNDQAINYIWEHFLRTFFSNDAIQLMDRWNRIRQGLKHRPFQPGSSAHQAFLLQLRNELSELSQLLPVQEEFQLINKLIN